MSEVEIFDNEEAAYKGWLQDNPTGFVVNTYRVLSARYLVLHRATCHTISEYRQHAGTPAFTGGTYIKVCAVLPSRLLAWARSVGIGAFSGYCTACKSAAAHLDDMASLSLELLAEAEQLRGDPDALSEALKNAPRKPAMKFVTSQVFVRSAAVVAAALNRANGLCEMCGSNAPFARKGNGQPYLEVHHKIPLAAGGDDDLLNAIAVCPNCHRKSHFG